MVIISRLEFLPFKYNLIDFKEEECLKSNFVVEKIYDLSPRVFLNNVIL
jgi:hypothetical protein